MEIGIVIVAMGALALAGYAVWQMSEMSKRGNDNGRMVGETVAKAVGTWPETTQQVIASRATVPPVEEWEPDLDRDPWMRGLVGELPDGLQKVVEEHDAE